MNKQKPLVIHIYRDMMRQANIFRQQAKKHTGLYQEHYDEKAQELFFWCGELEKTEEVNPTKKASSPENA